MKLKSRQLTKEELDKFIEEGNSYLPVRPLTKEEKSDVRFNEYKAIIYSSLIDEWEAYVFEIEDEDSEYNGKLFTNLQTGEVVIYAFPKSLFTPEGYSSVLDLSVRNRKNFFDVSSIEDIENIAKENKIEYISNPTLNLVLAKSWDLQTLPETWWLPVEDAGIERKEFRKLTQKERWNINSKKRTFNNYRGISLFIETVRNPFDLPIFTFFNEDIIFVSGPYKGLYLWSLPRLYAEINDPTEYEFALKVFGDYTLWEKIASIASLKKYVDEMRKSLKFMVKSKIVKEMMKVVEEGGPKAFQAAKWLSEQGWQVDYQPPEEKKNRVGRPKKEEPVEGPITEEDKEFNELLSSFKQKIEVKVNE